MKILFVLENYYPHIGGVETLFKSLCESLAAEGHTVTVFTSRVISDSSRSEKVNGVSIKRFWSGNRYVFTFLSIVSVWKLARKHDHVHTTSYNAALPAWIGSRLSGKKCTITFHEVWDELWLQLPWMSAIGARIHRMFEKMILALGFDRYIGVSQFTVDRLRDRVTPTAVQLIYNGIDYKEMGLHKSKGEHTEQIKSSFQFIYVGRLGVSKGLDILIPSFAEHLKQFKEDRLTLVVPKLPSSMLANIKSLIDFYSIDGSIRFVHDLSYSELCKHMQNSDAIVIPSYSEGFCYVAVESAALHVPIISSGQGALSETVSGLYIELNGLTVKELSDALTAAHQQKWRNKSLKKFTLEDSVSQYTELFSNYAPS